MSKVFYMIYTKFIILSQNLNLLLKVQLPGTEAIGSFLTHFSPLVLTGNQGLISCQNSSESCCPLSTPSATIQV